MTKKILIPVFLLSFFLLVIAMPVAVFAHSQDVLPTTFYACEAPTASTDGTVQAGQIDSSSITQDENLTCPVSGHPVDFTSKVQWSVTGPQGTKGDQGDPGVQGTQGPKGDTGPTGSQGPAGIPFSASACTETGLISSAAQENAVFCQSGIEADGGLVYTAAINAAKVRVMVGTPIATFPSTDWNGGAITYVEFTSSFHMEYHADNVVRVYNSLNQRVF